jgi:hypothetical protein
MFGLDSLYVLYPIFWAATLFNIPITLNTYLGCSFFLALAYTIYKVDYPDANPPFVTTAVEVVLRASKWGFASSLWHRIVWILYAGLAKDYKTHRATLGINGWTWYSGFFHGYPWLAYMVAAAWDTSDIWMDPAIELLHAHVVGPILQCFWSLQNAVQDLKIWIWTSTTRAWHQLCSAFDAAQDRFSTHVATPFQNFLHQTVLALGRDYGICITLYTAIAIGRVLDHAHAATIAAYRYIGDQFSTHVAAPCRNYIREATAAAPRYTGARFDTYVATPCRNVLLLVRDHGICIILYTVIAITLVSDHVYEATVSAYQSTRQGFDTHVANPGRIVLLLVVLCIALYTAMAVARAFNPAPEANASACRTTWHLDVDFGEIHVKFIRKIDVKFPKFRFTRGQAGQGL